MEWIRWAEGLSSAESGLLGRAKENCVVSVSGAG